MLDKMDQAETLRLLDAYVRIPTVSSQITAEMVGQVQNFWRGLGLELEQLWPAKTTSPATGSVNNPALFGEIVADVANAPTLLLYGHWDVQPAGEVALWQWLGQAAPPFAPTYFREEQLVGRTPAEVLAKVAVPDLAQVMMVARGTADNKGQHLANILGVLQAKAAGHLCWNVKILLDGEEEVGSPNLGAITQSHRARLQADFMVGSDGPKSDNQPTVVLGVRGLLALVLRCENGSGRMLHSGNYGNVVPTPVLPLARLLAQMEIAVNEMGRTTTGFRQQVERYFDQAAPDRARYAPFLYPTFNVNSILSEGATTGQRRTIIPSWAEASIDVRLIPGLAPQAVYERLAALTVEAQQREAGVQFSLEQGTATAGSFTAPDREGFAWLSGVVHRFWGERVRLIPVLGGTLPNDVFTEGLGLASYWLPAANSNNRQHDTNEHFGLEHFFRQQDFYATLVSTPY